MKYSSMMYFGPLFVLFQGWNVDLVGAPGSNSIGSFAKSARIMIENHVFFKKKIR